MHMQRKKKVTIGDSLDDTMVVTMEVGETIGMSAW